MCLKWLKKDSKLETINSLTTSTNDQWKVIDLDNQENPPILKASQRSEKKHSNKTKKTNTQVGGH